MPSKHPHYHHQATTDEAPLLFDDEAFQNGITFNVKLIGSMDIPRPMSRVEIVAAMRRVRLEYKSKGVKKRKVVLSVGVNGVKTALRIKKKRKHHLKYRNNPQQRDEITLQHHPIYRIFYVSHDSQDVKVFSYIARESSSNVFHCCVFKANKKKQALRIVRTIGQAFEVSHKLNSPVGADEENGQRTTTESPNEGSESSQRVENSPILASSKKPLISTLSSKHRPPALQNTWAKQATDSPTEFKSHDHQVQLLREQLEQEALNTQAAMSQLNLLREQLSTEMSARIEAENRNKQLLNHNKELLNHLHVLVSHIQELEGRPRDFAQLPSTKGSTSGSPQNPSPGPHQHPTFTPSSSLLLQSSLLELIESQLHRFYSPSLVVGNQHLDAGSVSTPVHKSVKLPAELLKPPSNVPQVKSALISRSLTPRSKVERWFVLSSGGPFETPEEVKVEGHKNSTESGFVSQRNLLTSLWKRVKMRRRRIRRWRQRSVVTV